MSRFVVIKSLLISFIKGHINVSLKACDDHLLKSSNKCIGASTLMNLLSNYCRNNDIKTSITVGIVGKNWSF
jgi:nuclear GTP-binding protein